MLQRLRCVDCGATWSVYPQGVSPGVRFSLRAEQAMVLLYVLGVPVGASTVLRLAQAQGAREELATQRRYWQGKVRVRRLGMDGTGVLLVGRREDPGVVVVVDQEQGVGLWVEAVDVQDAAVLARLLAWVVRRVQPEEVVSDEGVADPEALHQATAEVEKPPAQRLCAAHFRWNKMARLQDAGEEHAGVQARRQPATLPPPGAGRGSAGPARRPALPPLRDGEKRDRAFFPFPTGVGTVTTWVRKYT